VIEDGSQAHLEGPHAVREGAFTLIELLIVLIIISIMITLAVPQYSQLASRAYEGEILSSLSALRAAQRAYKSAHGEYPFSKDSLLSEAMPVVSVEDFADMKFVEWADLWVDGEGGSVWTDADDGLAGRYRFEVVTLTKAGGIDRR
jgi:prepilin-type N-terminal cleavage/methylation domain-containing protein